MTSFPLKNVLSIQYGSTWHRFWIGVQKLRLFYSYRMFFTYCPLVVAKGSQNMSVDWRVFILVKRIFGLLLLILMSIGWALRIISMGSLLITY
ncbi:hypothetical protein GDO81_014661 [Engystomops pustulosus]|uniref:Uncharacterized protein n=1 Tax=Engystomops pustulosus TaxID=76066 RepID=A0AAV7BBY0_ENGPU|nr:hypothetical protein GDO81_014661 [Engystomops pustulosus]